MGFDQNDPKPIVDTAKRTTKVNFSIVVAVLVFFAIGGGALAFFHHIHSSQ
ncbi:MAG TPA: hypothetical protein VFE25_14915 [Opitutaceae bacterium]|nr:hypothetical protein [Opitutaceae bacterium]